MELSTRPAQVAGVGEAGLPISYQAHAVSVMCEDYGWTDPGLLVDEISDRLRRARDEHARHGRPRAVVGFEEMIASMNIVEPELRRRLT
jgi:hypothetical protein